ncbi:MAG: hypothetical protein HFJ81_01015 [Clostridia bacterium]|nr:hypothetical protein [Clostridia bacterium]
MRKSLYKDISQPVEELATLVFHHFGKAPMGWTGIDKLTEYAHNEQFVKKVLALYDYVLAHDDLIMGINPSQYYKIIYKFQLASKSLDYEAEHLSSCYYRLANYGISVYNHTLYQIEDEISSIEFTDITDARLKCEVAYLSALLRSYSETLYCDEHTIAGEIYSPIDMDGDTVIARHYKWLDAKSLRSELRDCKYHGVKLYARYHGLKQKAVTDIVGNLLINENILSLLKSFYIEVIYTNGETKILTECEEIKEVTDYFKTIIPQLVNGYKNMSLQERLWKKIECEYYALKPFCDTVGIDWKPNKYPVDERLIADSNRPIVKANEEILTLTDDKEIKHKLFILNDPRVHW